MAFIDESKARDYLLVAAILDSDDLGRARRAIRALCLPGQPGRTDLARREACIQALVEDAAAQGVDRLCFERDETLVARDRRCLIEMTRRYGIPHLEYVHDSARSESLLTIPDAFAWAWARGGDWPRRCSLVGVLERIV